MAGQVADQACKPTTCRMEDGGLLMWEVVTMFSLTVAGICFLVWMKLR